MDDQAVLVVLVVAGVFLAAVVAYFVQTPCPKCGVRPIRHVHSRVDGGPDRRYKYNPQVCGSCGWSSYDAIDDDFKVTAGIIASSSSATARPEPVEKQRTSGEIIAETLRAIADARGPASRKGALEYGLSRISDRAARNELLLQASRMEVAAVLAKVAKLKTKDAKRRNLDEALQAIQADALSDELQAKEIELLQSARAKIV